MDYEFEKKFLDGEIHEAEVTLRRILDETDRAVHHAKTDLADLLHKRNILIDFKVLYPDMFDGLHGDEEELLNRRGAHTILHHYQGDEPFYTVRCSLCNVTLSSFGANNLLEATKLVRRHNSWHQDLANEEALQKEMDAMKTQEEQNLRRLGGGHPSEEHRRID